MGMILLPIVLYFLAGVLVMQAHGLSMALKFGFALALFMGLPLALAACIYLRVA
jgi:hypothetical protein